MNYLRWSSDQEEGYCVVSTPLVEHKLLTEGQPLAAKWPDDVTTRMKDDYPDDIDLADNLFGSFHPIVSARIRDIVLQHVPADSVEFLPVSIINHEGCKEPAEYFLLHPRTIVDCIDQEASMVDWNPLDPTELTGCMGLVLNKDNIPDDCKLFRLKHWGTEIIIRSDLVEILQSQGFTGLYFPEAEGYDGIG